MLTDAEEIDGENGSYEIPAGNEPLLLPPNRNGCNGAPTVAFTLSEEVNEQRDSSTNQWLPMENNREMMREMDSALSLLTLPFAPVRKATSASAIESLMKLLSALYALLLIIFSLTLELSTVLHMKRYASLPWIYECFHIYLYGTAILFFGYCHGFMLHRGWIRSLRHRSSSSLRNLRLSKSRLAEIDNDSIDKPGLERKVSLRSVSHSSATGSSLYLRLGCIVFGIAGIVSIGMELFQCIEENYDADSTTCDNMRIIKLCLGVVFTFIQMHFIFQNSKMTIHRSKNIARFGTMHLVAVNLWVWLRHLILEEFEVSREIETVHVVQSSNKLTNLQASKNLTYSSMLVGSVPYEEHRSDEEKKQFFYMVSGCANPEACLIRKSFTPILYTCMIEYSLIAAAVMFIVWRNIGLPVMAQRNRRKQNLRVDCSSSTNGLFIGLLFLVATFVSLMIFYIKIHADRNLDALWVFSLTDVALYAVSISACILGFWRTNKLSYEGQRHATGAQLLDDILLIVGLIGQLLFGVSGSVGLVTSHHEQMPHALLALLGSHVMRLVQVLLQTVFILGASRMVATTTYLQRTKPGREVVTFLMVVNLALFLVNTFEGQKASVNHALVDFYGQQAWAFVVQCTLPLSIFYRFHSSVCLAEIWKHSYRVRVQYG